MRIPFDSLTLSAVVAECQSLVGARIQRIIAPDDLTVILGCYKGKEHQLVISVNAEFARVHLSQTRPETVEEITTLCAALRKQVLDSRIVFIRQRGLDRILEIGVTGGKGDFQIVAELMGKHSNLMLVDTDRRVVAAAKWVGRKLSRRPILPGQKYEPPPFEPKPSLLEAKKGDTLKDFEGASPFLIKLVESGVGLERIQSAIKTGVYAPVLIKESGGYPLPLTSLGLNAEPAETISLALDRYYSQTVQEVSVAHEKQFLSTQLNRALDAKTVAQHGLLQAVETANTATQIQQMGELILAYQAQIQSGDLSLEAWDYEGNPIKISLQPDLTPAENADRLFHKARNAKDHIAEVRVQLEQVSDAVTELRSMLADLDRAETLPEVLGIRAAADQRRYLNRQTGPVAKEERPYAGHAVREATSPAGYKILYGTNATANDYLTTKVAKPNDWWLHVRGATSAHVILLTQNQPTKVQMPDLIFAAQIAVRNSVQKHATYVPVDYTLKKYVRKPRGSAVGFATYVNEKTLHVDP